MEIIELFYKAQEQGLTSAKLLHYFNIYNEIFKSKKMDKVNFLEIGVNKGGDLYIWENYFCNLNKLIGVDISDDCKSLTSLLKKTEIIIGDQGDTEFLQKLSDNYKNLDIILDDGGHQFHQQINTFNYLFKNLIEGGIYVIEDTHTSYDNYANLYPKDNVFNGGKNKSNTTTEYFKSLIDELHAWCYIKEHGVCPMNEPNESSWNNFLIKYNIKRTDIDYYREYIHSITFYDSIILIKKLKKNMPYIVFNDNCQGEKYFENKKIIISKQ